jgi:endonuclease I
VSKLPPIPSGARSAELKKLVQDNWGVIGGTVSKKEAAWLKRVAEHPAADAAVIQAIVDGTSSLGVSDSAAEAGAREFLASLRDKVERPSSGTVLDIRTSADEALSRPFGQMEAELPSLPTSLDRGRLNEILKRGWKDVKDGGIITTEELAWVHALATHPAADGLLHDEIGRRLDGARFHENVDKALLGRLRRGLRGEVPLVAAPAPRPPEQVAGAPMTLGQPRWPALGAELDAAEVGFAVEAQLKAHRKSFAHGQTHVLEADACAWLLEGARHPNADADLARKIGHRMTSFALSDDAVGHGALRLRKLLDQGAVPAPDDASVLLQTVRAALAFVRDVLTEAAGDDDIVDASELSAAVRPLDAAQAEAVRGMYEAVAGAEGSVTTSGLRALYQQACAGLSGEDARRLAEREVTQLCAFGASLVNLSHEVEHTQAFDGLDGDALKAALSQHAAGHIALGYDRARRFMFTQLDNDAGVVRDVYTGKTLVTSVLPDPDADGMNTEHTFPRSRGVGDINAAESDLHHLYPTDTNANALRSSYPFGVVVHEEWSEMGAKLGTDARGEVVFEPPAAHKGNVARALFYVATAYGLTLDDAQVKVLREWNRLDPVDDAERARNDEIEQAQGNRNPFVDNPLLADRIDEF